MGQEASVEVIAEGLWGRERLTAECIGQGVRPQQRAPWGPVAGRTARFGRGAS